MFVMKLLLKLKVELSTFRNDIPKSFQLVIMLFYAHSGNMVQESHIVLFTEFYRDEQVFMFERYFPHNIKETKYF